MKTLDQDFAHFLTYQGWTDLPQDVIEKLLVAYEHGDSRGRPKWLPIETAPTNTPVLVLAGKQQFVAWLQDDATDEWHDEESGESDLNGSWCVTDNKLGPFALRGMRPTHWMPLPEPPDQARGKGEL